MTILSCDSFDNPNKDVCNLGASNEVYLCSKSWTSFFDSPISLTLYVTSEDTYSINDVFDFVESTLEQYHNYFDKYNEYPNLTNVYLINHRLTSSVEIEEALYDAIAFALLHQEEIKIDDFPLFNIALGPVLSIWHDARENPLCEVSLSSMNTVCPVPNELLTGITFHTDPSKIVLTHDQDFTISFLEEGMEIDLGGFGKGYVSEIITDYLDELNVKYILNTGNSNVKAGGINPNSEDGFYTIALKRPKIVITDESVYFAYIKLPNNLSIVTSGNYQRFFIGLEDGLVYHHIIDPTTNYPGGEAMSVSILYEDGALADIYSTAIYLMPLEDGLAFVNQIEGLEAVWYFDSGDIIYSDHFESYLYIPS